MPVASTKEGQNRNISARIWFNLRSDPQPTWVDTLSGTPITTSQESETYFGLGAPRGLREWLGSRMSESPTAYTFTIKNRKFEKTIRVTRNEMRRDQSGLLDRRLNSEFRQPYETHWKELASSLLATGTTAVAYDGTAYFATTRTEGANLTSPDITTPTAPTVDEFRSAVWGAVKKMVSLTDNEGRPSFVGEQDFLVMIPPTFMEQAATALNSDLLASAGAVVPNNLRQQISGSTFRLIINPFLPFGSGGAFETSFCVFLADGQALIRQEEVPLEVGQTGPEYSFRWDTQEVGIMTIRGIGFGNWQSAHKVVFQ